MLLIRSVVCCINSYVVKPACRHIMVKETASGEHHISSMAVDSDEKL